jgi:hypothetical protein
MVMKKKMTVKPKATPVKNKRAPLPKKGGRASTNKKTKGYK